MSTNEELREAIEALKLWTVFIPHIGTVLAALEKAQADAEIYKAALTPCLDYWRKASSSDGEGEALIGTMRKLCEVAVDKLSDAAKKTTP